MSDVALVAIAAVVLVPIGVFVVECLLSVLPARRSPALAAGARSPAIVLIPAHNEEAVLEATLRALRPTLDTEDRVLVVADNCTDATADAARRCGAEVAERHDEFRRGKGFALAFGVRTIAEQWAPRTQGAALGTLGAAANDVILPGMRDCSSVQGAQSCTLGAIDPVIVFLDADCTVASQTIDALARRVAATGNPVQGLNLSESDAAGVQAVSSLGFHFKNLVRPAGLDRIGVPCHLMGTGMALPWSLAASVQFAGGNLVEDMQLGIDLALAGRPTAFCREALVTSRLPASRKAFLSQRTRWEHGHLRTSLTQIPRLLGGFARSCDLRLLGLAMDLTVPPFSMLVFVWLAALCLAGVGAWFGASLLPAVLLAAGGAGIALGVAAGWATHCRREIPWTAFASIPIYMVRKLPIYVAFLFRRGQRDWVRTDREEGTGCGGSEIVDREHGIGKLGAVGRGSGV